jgi:hypothetical protein
MIQFTSYVGQECIVFLTITVIVMCHELVLRAGKKVRLEDTQRHPDSTNKATQLNRRTEDTEKTGGE